MPYSLLPPPCSATACMWPTPRATRCGRSTCAARQSRPWQVRSLALWPECSLNSPLACCRWPAACTSPHVGLQAADCCLLFTVFLQRLQAMAAGGETIRAEPREQRSRSTRPGTSPWTGTDCHGACNLVNYSMQLASTHLTLRGGGFNLIQCLLSACAAMQHGALCVHCNGGTAPDLAVRHHHRHRCHL